MQDMALDSNGFHFHFHFAGTACKVSVSKDGRLLRQESAMSPDQAKAIAWAIGKTMGIRPETILSPRIEEIGKRTIATVIVSSRVYTGRINQPLSEGNTVEAILDAMAKVGSVKIPVAA